MITKTRMDEITKENTEIYKQKHHFEDLSKKIIGAAIRVHRALIYISHRAHRGHRGLIWIADPG